MASAWTRDPNLRGLLIADERAALWTAQSSYTQAGPRAGGPVATGVSHMQLTARGDQPAASTIELQALRAGVARSNPALSAAYAMRHATSGDWYGWDAPSLMARVEALEPVNTGTPSDVVSTGGIDCLGLPNGTLLTVYECRDTSAGQQYQVRLTTRATDGTTSQLNIYTTTFATPTSQGMHPCLVRLPDARILCLFWTFDPDLNQANIRVHYSDDDGATWAVGQQFALDQPITYGTATGSGVDVYVLGRLRAAYSLGQVLVMADLTHGDTDDTYRSKLMQAASSDYGMTLERVQIWSADLEGPAGVDCIGTPAGFLVAYAAGADPTAADAFAPLSFIRIGSAYEPTEGAVHTAPAVYATPTFDSAGVAQTADAITSSPGVVLALDGDTVWAAYVSDGPSPPLDGIVVYSPDYGSSWAGCYATTGTTTPSRWVNGGASGYARRLAGDFAEGTFFVAAACLGQSATQDTVLLHYLGGYSTVTMPGYARWLEPGRRVAWSVTWVPYNVPGSMAWTAAGAGAGVLDDGRLTVTTTAGQTRTYTVTPTTSLAQGLIVGFSVDLQSGGSPTTTAVSLMLRTSDGSTEGYQCSIRIGATSWRIYDDTAGTVIGGSVAATTSTGIDVIVALASGVVRTWWRQRGADTLRAWTAGPTASLTDSGGTGGNSIQWGHRSASAAVSRWYDVCYATGTDTGGQMAADAFTNPDDLHPYPFSAITGTQVGQGVTVTAESGPAVRGDIWTISTRYDYEIERILPSSQQLSPRWSWRSTSTAAQTIALRLSEHGDTSLGSDVIAVAAYNSNVSRVIVSGYDLDTTSWVTLGTVDISEGLNGLRWTREGTTVTPQTSGNSTNEPYLYHEECEGWTFALTDSVARRVAHNAEGKWTDETTRTPVLALAGVDGTEATSGTGGYLIPDSWVILIDLAGATYSAIRLQIPAPTTGIPAPAEDYWEIGTLVVGPVVLHGDESGWGRTLDTTLGAEISEARDGTRRATNARPPRRVVEYGWPDGIDTTDSTNAAGNPDPDYVLGSAASGALAVAAHRDAPWQVEGVARRLAGATAPVVYLPRVARFGENEGSRILNRRWSHMLGRVVSDIAIETVQGDELENEVVRVAVLRIEEET